MHELTIYTPSKSVVFCLVRMAQFQFARIKSSEPEPQNAYQIYARVF